MSTSDQELIAFSESFLAQGVSEVALRAAISRSYYGVFHQCKKVADAYELPSASQKYRGSHERTIYRFLGFGDDTTVGMLRKHKMMRVKADYQLSDEITLDEASMHVASCRRLSKYFSMLGLVSPRGAV